MELTTLLLITREARSYAIPVVIDSQLPKHDQMTIGQPIQVELADGRLVLMPAGFVTDCHSTPPWSQSLLPAYDTKTNLAAIVHDYLYMHWEEFTANYSELAIELAELDKARAYADGVYKELMERFQQGESRLERSRNQLYYHAVRLFGGWNWRKFRYQAKNK